MLIFYFGFILLVAFNKPLLSILLSPGLSLGILLGGLVMRLGLGPLDDLCALGQ